MLVLHLVFPDTAQHLLDRYSYEDNYVDMHTDEDLSLYPEQIHYNPFC